MSSAIITNILKRGDTGEAIRKLQYNLYIMGYLSKSDIQGVAGVYHFGPKTEAAVKDIQKKYNIANNKNISVDGRVDFITGTIIERIANITPKRGSTGSLVEASSNYLIWAGLLPISKTELDIEMEEAIKKFQFMHGLYQTGTLNAKTVTKLVTVQMSKIKTTQQQIIIKEVLNGEVNHETKPIFGSGILLLGIGTWFIWYMQKKKKVIIG